MTAKLNFTQTYLMEEFAEEYKERHIDRRELLRRTVALTGSVPLAATVLVSLGCSGGSSTPAATATTAAPATPAPPTPVPSPTGPGVAANDPAIQVADVKYPGQAGDVLAYLARPSKPGAVPGVIVIHENRGLVDQTKDVARRYAKEGFAALAVDLVSRGGGTGADPVAAMAFLGRSNPDDLTQDLVSSVGYLKAQSFVKSGSYGVTGFCMGGGFVWDLAIASPDLKAAVPFYGPVRQPDQIVKIGAPVLAICGGNDPRVTTQDQDAVQRLRTAGKTAEIKVYDGASHAFFNETGASYNAQAAADAWVQALAWFRKYLSA